MNDRGEQAIRSKIVARIQERRKGTTLRQLAEVLGVTPTQAYRLLKGEQKISASDVYLIARALEERVDNLFPPVEGARIDEVSPDARAFVSDVLAIQDAANRKHVAQLAMRLSGRAGPGDRRWRKKTA